jgi:hypothetical protein
MRGRRGAEDDTRCRANEEAWAGDRARMLPAIPFTWSNLGMRTEPRDLASFALAIALVLALVLALVQTIRLWWIGFARTSRLRKMIARAADGEARAERILRDVGFDILARQATQTWNVRVDGVAVAIDLRADYIVMREGRRFVAEVKTGRAAPRIDSAATRRQLLEYRCAFDVDGVLLVDAEESIVHAIEFELPHATTEAPSRGWLGVAFAIGAVLLAATALAFR